MITKPTMTMTESVLRMTVPYALNESFREIFKTAEWNRSEKVFIARATTQNRNKWAKFTECVKEASEALENADQAEATVEQLERLANRAERALEEARASLKTIENRAEVARQRRAQAEAQIAEFVPVLDKANTSLQAVLAQTASAEQERDVVIAPALALYEAHGFERILNEFSAAARKGYRGKEAASRAQAEITELKKDLKKIGFRLKAIDELVGVSLNRPDNIAHYAAQASATMRSGLTLIEG